MGVDALGRVLRTDLVAVFLQKPGDKRPLLVADAGLSVENEGDRRQRRRFRAFSSVVPPYGCLVNSAYVHLYSI